MAVHSKPCCYKGSYVTLKLNKSTCFFFPWIEPGFIFEHSRPRIIVPYFLIQSQNKPMGMTDPLIAKEKVVGRTYSVVQ